MEKAVFAFRTINSEVIWAPCPLGQSLILWAETQGGPQFVWALNLQALEAFLFPGLGGEAADSTFSSLDPSSSIPPSPSVLFTLCSPAAVPPRRHSRPPRPWRPPRASQSRRSPWERREVLPWVGSGADGGLAVGIFFFVFCSTQAGEWTYDYMWPGLKIYAFALCGKVTSPHWETIKHLWKRNNIRL